MAHEPVERVNKETKRSSRVVGILLNPATARETTLELETGSRVVGIFLNPATAIRQVGAIPAYMHDESPAYMHDDRQASDHRTNTINTHSV